MRAQDFSILNEDDLFEVNMSPSSLKAAASQINALVGIEYEMMIPEMEPEDDDEEMEEDWGEDVRVHDIDDIVSFYRAGDYNTRYVINRLEASLEESFNEWKLEDCKEQFDSEADQLIRAWLERNEDPETVALLAGHKDGREADSDDYRTVANDASVTENDFYDSAREEFTREMLEEDDFSQSSWLRSLDIRTARDVLDWGPVRSSIDLTWPYWTYGDSDQGGTAAVVAAQMERLLGTTVHHSSQSKGATRAPDAYSIDPDDSLHDGSGYVGLELVSPPLPTKQLFDDLREIREWADKNRVYTDESTGLHINVSVPNYSRENLDFVKLAVLLGDKYVLEKFGRTTNTYCNSALGIIENEAMNKKKANELLGQLKNRVEEIASKILHSGNTDKYTSINTKRQYVEFRSPGGDWLDESFNKIEDTTYRFIVALDAACDPNKYKEEYYKKLYKILRPETNADQGRNFLAKFLSGEVKKDQYISILLGRREQRMVDKGIAPISPYLLKDGDWIVSTEKGNKTQQYYFRNDAQINTKDQAIEAAMRLNPIFFNQTTLPNIKVEQYTKDSGAVDKFWEVQNDATGARRRVYAKNRNQAIALVRSQWGNIFPEEHRVSAHDVDAIDDKPTQDFKVSNNENGASYVISASSPIAAARLAQVTYPREFPQGSGPNIQVTLPGMEPLQTPAPTLSKPYMVTNLTNGERDRSIYASSPDDAIRIARHYYRGLWDSTDELTARPLDLSDAPDPVNEDWKSTAKGIAAAGAVALGVHGLAGQQTQEPIAPQMQVQHAPVDAATVRQVMAGLSNPYGIALRKAAKAAGITGTELAQFLAQCAHETQNFASLKEFGGRLDFKKYDPKFNPQKAKLLGNTHAGDGARYHGRGFIQLTGRENYRKVGKALGLPLEQNPELVERPDVAAKVAVWYWQNRVAPKVNNFNNTQEVTRPINSALRGIDDRVNKFNAVMQLINNTRNAARQ